MAKQVKNEKETAVATAEAPARTGVEQPTTAVSTQVTGTVSTVAGMTAEELQRQMDDINLATQENILQGEVQISRLSVAQPITGEVARGENGWQAGAFFDNMSREVLSQKRPAQWLMEKGVHNPPQFHSVLIVPVFRMPSEFCRWPTKEERAMGQRMFLWKSVDPMEDRVRENIWPPRGKWKGKPGEAPPVTEHLNILSLILDPEDGSMLTDFVLVSFAKTSFRTGGKLVSACQQHTVSRLPWWGRAYWLYTDQKTREQQTWYVQKFAKGPALLEIGEDRQQMESIFVKCLSMARDLSNREESPDHPGKTRGRMLQEMYVNAAQFDVTEGEETGFEDGISPGDEAGGSTESPNF